jgi:hypothetical protein
MRAMSVPVTPTLLHRWFTTDLIDCLLRKRIATVLNVTMNQGGDREFPTLRTHLNVLSYGSSFTETKRKHTHARQQRSLLPLPLQITNSDKGVRISLNSFLFPFPFFWESPLHHTSEKQDFFLFFLFFFFCCWFFQTSVDALWWFDMTTFIL